MGPDPTLFIAFPLVGGGGGGGRPGPGWECIFPRSSFNPPNPILPPHPHPHPNHLQNLY
jgi:hypothetical protein